MSTPCTGLGTRLKNIGVGTIVPAVINFTIPDWVLVGDYYTFTVLAGTHMQGPLFLTQVQEKIGSEYFDVLCDGSYEDGVFSMVLRVVSDPDARFNGRILYL